jgi:hypothetical protein
VTLTGAGKLIRLCKVTETNSKTIRKIIALGALLLLSASGVYVHSMETEVLLAPPGLRPVKDPFLVIPADFHYPNRPIQLPRYRGASGNPAGGWSARFVETRRFASDQSAWVFFRDADLRRSETRQSGSGQGMFRFWPAGTTLIIEIYKGNAFQKEKDKLLEVAAMSKNDADAGPVSKAFYPVRWAYARYTPDGAASITPGKVRECHQCHSIAFHLTGDLVFTRFPIPSK